MLAGTWQPVGAVTVMAAVTPMSPPCTREGPSPSWACVTAAKGRAQHPAPHPQHPRCGRALQAQPVLPGAWLLPATRVGAAGSHHPCPSQQERGHGPSLPQFPLWALWPLSYGVPRGRGARLSITEAGRDPGFAPWGAPSLRSVPTLQPARGPGDRTGPGAGGEAEAGLSSLHWYPGSEAEAG